MMSLSLVAAFLWVIAATVTAFLPFRRQFPPGILLLATAPVLLIWIGIDHGFWVAMVGVAGFGSMFRRPLIALGRHLLGLPVHRPGGGPDGRPR